VTLAAPDWLDGAEVTYRQLDYWTRQGWLHPETRAGGRGPGYHRRWPIGEQRVAGIMARLVAVGFGPAAAAIVARAAAGTTVDPRTRVVTVALRHGVEIVIALAT
jgi:hypothetical protein